MTNGEPSYNPVSDVVVRGMEVYTPEIDALIRELATFTDEYGVSDPFEELDSLLAAATSDPSRRPELYRELVELRDRLAEEEP
jgi:hypothetical protein